MTDSEDWEFRELCRKYMAMPVEERIRRWFRRADRRGHKAVSRSFATMAEYRAWCDANLPAHLGFRRPASTRELGSRTYETDNEDAFEKLRRVDSITSD